MGAPHPPPGIFGPEMGARSPYGVGLTVGLGAAQTNCCCRLTVMVTVLKAAVTALLPVLRGRVKLLVALSPVMSIGVGTATPLIGLTAATGPWIDTMSLGLTETLETW